MQNSKIFRAALLFYIWLLIISPFSYFQIDSLIGTAKHFMSFAVLIASIQIITKLSSTSLANKQKPSIETLIHLIFITLVLASLVLSIIGIFQFITGAEQFAQWDDSNVLISQTRVYSLFGNPNLYGSFLIAVLPINLYLIFQSFKASSKILFSCAAIFNFVSLLLTGSRSSLIAFAFAIFIGFIFILKTKNQITSIQSRKIFKSTVFIIILLSALIACLSLISHEDLVLNFTERLKTIFMWDQYSTNNYRLQVWSSCLEIAKENFILGIGLGHEVFRKVYALYMQVPYEALSAYSIYLEILIESGIIGLALFLSILFFVYKKLYFELMDYNFKLALPIALSITALLIQGFVDTLFFRPPIQVIFWVLVAIIISWKATPAK